VLSKDNTRGRHRHTAAIVMKQKDSPYITSNTEPLSKPVVDATSKIPSEIRSAAVRIAD
jgi:hypothetical protein